MELFEADFKGLQIAIARLHSHQYRWFQHARHRARRNRHIHSPIESRQRRIS